MENFNKEKIAYHVKQILIELGEDVNREGLRETPKRVANMYEEVFEGMRYTNDEIIEMFNKTFEDNLDTFDDLVLVKDIYIHSYCEHHMALMYNMRVSVGYIKNDKIIGISKIARVVDMVGKRLQLQEKIGEDIAYIIGGIVNSDNIAVFVEGEHSCMSSRGIKKYNSKTITTTFKGKFKNDESFKQRFILLVK